MNKLIITILIFANIASFSQNITLQECIDSAMARYPLSQQKILYNDIALKEIEIIKSSNLPQIDLTARASWQSEVMELNINLPGINIPELNKDQYKVQLEITQSIYKGGLTKSQKILSNTENEISNSQNNIELMKIKNMIIGLYFQILLSDNAMEILIAQRDILEKKLSEIEAQIKQGILLAVNADVIEAEILTLDQRLLDLSYNRKSLESQFSKLTGFENKKLIKLEKPITQIDFSLSHKRPEYQYLELNRAKIETLKSMQNATTKPMAYGFSTLGYGRPGFNYLNNDFAPYALVGIGVNWKLWDWRKAKQNVKILDLKSETLLNQQKAFEINLNSELIALQSEIAKQEILLAKAKEIIPIRERIMQNAENQFLQGIIRSSEYIDEIKKHEKAVLEMKTIELKLALSKLNYLMALGQI